ncbi:peptidase C1 [candidate division KSB1 bacterium]|nr:peptidase C1 [candidate division KSB1 bacterium]
MSIQKASIFILLFLLTLSSYAQDTFYKETKTYRGNIDTVLSMDFSKIPKPESVESFDPLFHFPPIRQDTTGTCWAFATISYLESELYRLGKGEIKLSEMFVVYHEYLEKARRYVKYKGNSAFAQGSEENAAILRIKQYGIVRAEDYDGLLPGQTKYSHGPMIKEMRTYLKFAEENGYWDEKLVLANIKMILNKYMGEPPATIPVTGSREVTPVEYATEVLELPLDDYMDFMSFRYIPFYTKGEYRVPDNWWHSIEYHNVPLPEWYEAIKTAIKNGFTVAIGGDVSEIGKSGENDIAIIPEFDIDPGKINQDAREFRFSNETSTDDHALHIVGYQHRGGYDWFLIKDSGYSATLGKFRGYYFFREDFIKLKMLTFMVHRDAVKDLLKKFQF